MTKELNKHQADYLFLAGILILFLVGSFSSNAQPLIQTALAAGLGVTYFMWGIIHHKNSGILTSRIMLEYFFVGLLATSLLIVVNI